MRKQLQQIKYSTAQGGEQVIKNITLRGNEDKGGGGLRRWDTLTQHKSTHNTTCRHASTECYTHTPVHS